jgi:ATP-dependent DNA ligase
MLESLAFAPGCHICPRFDDGPALWVSVGKHRLEGVVAKRLHERYLPGERAWIKRKNPA